MLRHQSHHEPTVIGFFSDASDARRALNSLREHHFDVNAAFRGAAPSPAGSESGHWFGQLRQIYQNRSDDTPGGGSTDFEAMLTRLDLSRQEMAVLERDLRVGAVITVSAGERNQAAQSGSAIRQRKRCWSKAEHAFSTPTTSNGNRPPQLRVNPR